MSIFTPIGRSCCCTLIILLTMLFIMYAATESVALEMSSKRDCVVCHIMWMDEFRSEKETLIKWESGNVLMKDTQGVVSSEDMCYSCHDGYIMDSRSVAWKGHGHPVFVRPSEEITLSPDLPLSVKGEIYCGTCHSAHGRGAPVIGDQLGRTSVFREKNEDSALCRKCHAGKADYRRSKGHPLGRMSRKLPAGLGKHAGKAASRSDMVICESCHVMHGAPGNKMLIMENEESELCLTCHQERSSLISTKHDLRLTLPKEKNTKGLNAFESGPCGACHLAHDSTGKSLWAREVLQGNPATASCQQCHSNERGINIKGIGEETHPINIRIFEGSKDSLSLPLYLAEGSESYDGSIQCFTCHDIHRWDPVLVDNRGGKGIEGDMTNSFLRIADRNSGLCLHCHQDKGQTVRSDHNLSVTSPKEKNSQGLTAELTGTCGACHVAHNAVGDHMWAKNLEAGLNVNQLCTVCHSESGSANKKISGKNSHPVEIETTENGGALPLYTDEGQKSVEGKIACLTCHDPHIWDPSGSSYEYEFGNIDGNSRNSFLRMPASPSPLLCASCHKKQVLIAGTDHDLSVTAPDAVNLQVKTVSDTGICGACHLVHNSTANLKLWARARPLSVSNSDAMNELCRSCHAAGEIAGNKLPVISEHPEDTLINNILRCERDAVDYTPLYDSSGRETNLGNISCASCHDAHQWKPGVANAGSGKNEEGNATNSFLRNLSYSNICIDCHGMDGLFRYKYFHNPDTRVEQ
ncbi:MAG: hypothetical protein ISR96_10520 [Nitrospira sp.]|nr:hypothetical protein [bacterium]MBL7049936.1 hypothetical protein [Nitrospira sp.]